MNFIYKSGTKNKLITVHKSNKPQKYNRQSNIIEVTIHTYEQKLSHLNNKIKNLAVMKSNYINKIKELQKTNNNLTNKIRNLNMKESFNMYKTKELQKTNDNLINKINGLNIIKSGNINKIKELQNANGNLIDQVKTYHTAHNNLINQIKELNIKESINANMINELNAIKSMDVDKVKELQKTIDNLLTQLKELNTVNFNNIHKAQLLQEVRDVLFHNMNKREERYVNTNNKLKEALLENTTLIYIQKDHLTEIENLKQKVQDYSYQIKDMEYINAQFLGENDMIKKINLNYENKIIALEQLAKYQSEKLILDKNNKKIKKVISDYDVICYICRESTDLIILSCEHKICKNCKDELENQSCPYCRKSI